MPQLHQSCRTAVASRMGALVSTWVVLSSVVGSPAAFGQLPQAKLYSLFPPGAQAGTSVDLTLTSGADLEEANQLIFSHPGIKAVQKTNMVDGKPQPVASQFTVSIDPTTPPGI